MKIQGSTDIEYSEATVWLENHEVSYQMFRLIN